MPVPSTAARPTGARRPSQATRLQAHPALLRRGCRSHAVLALWTLAAPFTVALRVLVTLGRRQRFSRRVACRGAARGWCPCLQMLPAWSRLPLSTDAGRVFSLTTGCGPRLGVSRGRCRSCMKPSRAGLQSGSLHAAARFYPLVFVLPLHPPPHGFLFPAPTFPSSRFCAPSTLPVHVPAITHPCLPLYHCTTSSCSP